ncbi:MAG: hypothetical protein F6K55_01245 [Moorea sp. SIO4A3]|nr:hypothetical protein [Moorena sp. SIO4A3]
MLKPYQQRESQLKYQVSPIKADLANPIPCSISPPAAAWTTAAIALSTNGASHNLIAEVRSQKSEVKLLRLLRFETFVMS